MSPSSPLSACIHKRAPAAATDPAGRRSSAAAASLAICHLKMLFRGDFREDPVGRWPIAENRWCLPVATRHAGADQKASVAGTTHGDPMFEVAKGTSIGQAHGKRLLGEFEY